MTSTPVYAPLQAILPDEKDVSIILRLKPFGLIDNLHDLLPFYLNLIEQGMTIKEVEENFMSSALSAQSSALSAQSSALSAQSSASTAAAQSSMAPAADLPDKNKYFTIIYINKLVKWLHASSKDLSENELVIAAIEFITAVIEKHCGFKVELIIDHVCWGNSEYSQLNVYFWFSVEKTEKDVLSQANKILNYPNAYGFTADPFKLHFSPVRPETRLYNASNLYAKLVAAEKATATEVAAVEEAEKAFRAAKATSVEEAVAIDANAAAKKAKADEAIDELEVEKAATAAEATAAKKTATVASFAAKKAAEKAAAAEKEAVEATTAAEKIENKHAEIEEADTVVETTRVDASSAAKEAVEKARAKKAAASVATEEAAALKATAEKASAAADKAIIIANAVRNTTTVIDPEKKMERLLEAALKNIKKEEAAAAPAERTQQFIRQLLRR